MRLRRQPGQFLLAPDERLDPVGGRLRGQRRPFRRRGRHRLRWPGGLAQYTAVLGEDRLFQLDQGGAGIQSHLVGQDRPGLA